MRKYTDFCLDPSVINAADDYIYELKFFLVKIRKKEELDLIRAAADRLDVQWGVRAAGHGISGEARERSTERGTEVSLGRERILRPKVGIMPPVDVWLEFTPALLTSAIRTPGGYRWLKHILKKNIDRAVLGSDLPTPPSVRDVIALIAWLVGVPQDTGDVLIRQNSARLREAIVTCD